MTGPLHDDWTNPNVVAAAHRAQQLAEEEYPGPWVDERGELVHATAARTSSGSWRATWSGCGLSSHSFRTAVRMTTNPRALVIATSRGDAGIG